MDDFDEKVEKLYDESVTSAGLHNLPSSDFLKKIIKAEVITKLPDLGGEVPEDSDGFQGSVDIKRVTPNKDIGEAKSTGTGETASLESELTYDDLVEGNYEATIKEWEKGKKLKLRYDATVYKQTESQINPGSDTGDWQPVYDEKTSSNLKIEAGEEVEYLGTYKNYTNPLSNEITTYVQIKSGDTEGFIKAQYLIEPDEANKSQENSEEETKTGKVVTSRSKEDEKKRAGKDGEEYTIAIGAGHTSKTGATNGELIEGEMTIKVAEKVEKLFEDYSNITVVQTGSTSENPSVGNAGRTEAAREAEADLCVQIHFNSGGGTGVEVIYKENDGISQQLAEVLSESISGTMSLENRGAKTDTSVDKNLGIIENTADSGFPSVVTEGGFVDGDYEYLKTEEALDKYAQGIVDGVVKYLSLDHSAYTSSSTQVKTVTDSIESKITNLKYVTPEDMESYMTSDDEDEREKALSAFTIDEDKNVIVATWSCSGGVTEIKENSPINLTTAVQKYALPFEYLLFFYMDTNTEEFSSQLADKIIDETEMVLVVEDNVSTTKVVNRSEERRISYTPDDGEPYDSGEDYDWTETVNETSIIESSNTTVSFTYVDTWFVKAYRENSYSEAILQMGEEDEIITNIAGKATTDGPIQEKQNYNGATGGGTTEDGKLYKWRIEGINYVETTKYDHSYTEGDMKVQGKENTFVDLYLENNMQYKVREEYLFQIMEKNEKTQNFLDLTKYLIYKATGISYDGIIEFDFSVYDLTSFTSTGISATNALWEFLKAWEGHEGLSEDGTKYKIGLVPSEKYGSTRTVGYGVDLDTSGLEPQFIAAGYSTNVGDYVDVEFVDNIAKSELNTRREGVIAKVASCIPALNDQQIDALTMISYQYGNIGNFVTVYNQYGNTEELRQNLVVNGYHPFIKGPESNGRAAANWKLFHEGIYTDQQGNEIKVISSNVIVQAAIEVHQDVRENGYKYEQIGDRTAPYTTDRLVHNSKSIDCSLFVTWVLQQAGIEGFPEGVSQWNSGAFMSNPLGWQEISATEVQPGDILVYPNHVEIFAGYEGSAVRVYNCGSPNSIQSAGTTELPESSRTGRNINSAKILRPN